MKVKIGCCGFPVGKNRYYERFPVVELQKTFYQPPQPAPVKKWRVEAMKKVKDYKDTVRKVSS
ncbi:DUF72 domain-containing protein [Candidatus Aerophobetes bacterium]|nr:DUF72 domain-containing protein [Candidatus Aerophobetes bacterium]